MSDEQQTIETWYLNKGKTGYFVEWGGDLYPCYSMLKGPDGFECVLTEPEDRNWGRDGKDAWVRLQQQHDRINELTKERDELRKQVNTECNIRYMAQEETEHIVKERDELRAVVEKYADRDNWGYYDDSGCSKGHGSSTDACFIGPDEAEAALAATQNGGEG